MKIRAIVTGVTGMVGEGVLHECLQHPDVESVLVLGRRPCGVVHPKLKEIVRNDLFELDEVEEELRGYNACYFCLGVSSVGMKEADYSRISYDLTLSVAERLVRLNPDMTFCYVTGSGTDSTEKGKVMWARVKGRAENHLLRLGFRDAYMFRPGFIQPTEGMKNVHRYYSYIRWLYRPMKRLMPNSATTNREIGLAMINAVIYGSDKKVLDNIDISKLAQAGER
ncbi:NAD-dependent epimerase/dehydratase family protein [Paenibacillus sp. NPDC058071]|uniref:NAD-dependent epimerase/dehydratase family protein n=1 Tax=Paenibacillus sp. NPDC058071 TaxID=3346326 RepID=UPI0036DE403D